MTQAMSSSQLLGAPATGARPRGVRSSIRLHLIPHRQEREVEA